jgi:hypothetical protein
MNEGLSAGDILALTKNNENGMWDNPFIYLVWLAVLGGGNGLFGNRGDAAVQGAITRSDLFEGFNNQDVNGQLRGITNGICDGFYAINSGLKDGFYGTQGALAENRFAAEKCCCETNRNIDAVRYEGAQNTCAITNAIHAEGEATRALINANTMQDLRDKLEARDRDILARDFQLSQLSQNAYLVNELRPCAKPAYITCSPYTTANACGTCGAFGI